jgi:uncharacterized protein YoxC
MSEIQFTLQDLMIFSAFIVGIIAGIFLIIVLFKLKKVISSVQALVDDNKDSITKTINATPGVMDDIKVISTNIRDVSGDLNNSLPVILKDTEVISGKTKASMETVSSVIDNIGTGINDTVNEYKNTTSSIVTYIQIAEEIFTRVYKAFTKK